MNKNLLIVLAFLLFNIGYGQTLKTWTGATSTDWEERTNWSPVGVPTASHNVLITNTTNQPVITDQGVSCAVLTLSNSIPGSTIVLTIKGGGAFYPSSIIMNSSGDTSDCSLNIGTGGTVSVSGDITMTGTALQNDVTFSGDGNLIVGGIMTGGVLNSTVMGTVNYAGSGPLSVGEYTYNNLTLSGTGVRTITTSKVLVNGIFTIASSGTASAAPTYGSTASLKYNTTSSTVGPEWVTPFTARGGVEIMENANVTLDNSLEKRFNDRVPLIIGVKASLTVTDAKMYFGGNFVNNRGVLNTNQMVYLTGSADQNIGIFTSTGGVAMIKNDGTATFTGSINSKQIIIEGLGTLDLGDDLTHSFTDWVRTQGTLKASSSILNILGNVVGNGGSFDAGTSTVNFNGGAQNLGTGSITYNNLTLSGSAIKTFGAKTTINETFSLSTGIVANLTADLVHSAKYIKLGDTAQAGGSWGSRNSNAVNKNDTYFVLNNGIVNIGPTIAVSTNTIAALTSTYGTVSDAKTFDISGLAMTEGILVTPPREFEVSIDGITYTNTVPVGGIGNFANTNVFVRLKGTIPAGNYFGNVVLSSGDTTTPINIAIPNSTVNKAPLTITTDSKFVDYGDSIPVLTASYDKFVNGDTSTDLGTVEIKTIAIKGSTAGKYDITVGGTISSNYEITYSFGSLTIKPVALTITTISDSKIYGKDNPVLKLEYSGFITGEDESNLLVKPEIVTDAKKESPVGKYAISADRANSLNYTITYIQSGFLTIDRADLIIKAISVNKAHGDENPALKVEYIGFKNGDSEAQLDPQVIINTNANKDSAIGEYSIIVQGALSSNYTIEFVNGILKVIASNNAGLSDIVISNGTLDQPFDTTDKGYNVVVPNDVNSYVINPVPSNPNATVVMTVDGVIIDPASPFDLKVGDNEIKIVVTAEDGITTEEYTVIVTREDALSNNAGLTDLAISQGTLSPAFAETTKDYAATVPNDITTIKVTPVSEDATAKITVDGKEVASGTASGEIPLHVGKNEITTVITAQDGTTQTYTVIVTREDALSTNAGLTDLAISEGILSPAFAEANTDYTTTVTNDIASIKITPISDDTNATITVNGKVVPSGTASADIELLVGENTITTVVTAQDGTTKTYTVIVTREDATTHDNAGLSDIVISDGALSPVFNTDTNDYRIDVPNSTDSIVINPKPIDPDATVEMIINGKTISDNTAPIDLNVGDNVITVVVTAPDGTKDTYIVIVNRADAVPQTIIPTNIITPNGDGKNDYWVIPGIESYPNNSVKVFDRAARLVYSANNYNNDRDGTFKGSPVNEDTYYYLIDLGNGTPKLKGFISILRN